MIRNIQLLRAVAALLVVWCHSTGQWGGLLPWLRSFAFASGYAGVDLFFVISGFVISVVAERATEQKTRLAGTANFAIDRVFRIYPIYWVALAVAMVIAYFATGSITEGSKVPLWQIATLTTPGNPVIVVAWTLCFEMFFYALVTAVLLVSWRYFRFAMPIVAVLYGAVIIAVILAGGSKSFFLSPIILDFLFGVLVASIVRYAGAKWSRAFVLFGAIGLAYGIYLMMVKPASFVAERPFYLGVPSAFLLYGMIGLEKTWQAPSWAVALGNASYSTYLWHAVVLHPTRILALKFFPSLLTVVIILVSMTALGLLSHRFIEKPIAKGLARLKARWHQMSSSPQGRPVAPIP